MVEQNSARLIDDREIRYAKLPLYHFTHQSSLACHVGHKSFARIQKFYDAMLLDVNVRIFLPSRGCPKHHSCSEKYLTGLTASKQSIFILQNHGF